MPAFRVLDRAMRSRLVLSAWNSTSSQRSAAASARRGKASRITWTRTKSTRVRRSVVSSHSRQRLSLWCSPRTRAAARTAAKASAGSGAACRLGRPDPGQRVSWWTRSAAAGRGQAGRPAGIWGRWRPSTYGRWPVRPGNSTRSSMTLATELGAAGRVGTSCSSHRQENCRQGAP